MKKSRISFTAELVTWSSRDNGNKDGERTSLLFYPRMILINLWIDRKHNLHKYGVIFSIYHRRRIQDTVQCDVITTRPKSVLLKDRMSGA